MGGGVENSCSRSRLTVADERAEPDQQLSRLTMVDDHAESNRQLRNQNWTYMSTAFSNVDILCRRIECVCWLKQCCCSICTRLSSS